MSLKYKVKSLYINYKPRNRLPGRNLDNKYNFANYTEEKLATDKQ